MADDPKPNAQANTQADGGGKADINPGGKADTLLAQNNSNQGNADAGKAGGQTDAEKAAADKAAAEAKAKADAEAKAKEGAPEKYEFKAPEGQALDPEGVQKLSEIAKELNLSQEKAQKFVDLAVEHTAKIQKQVMEAQEKAWTAARDKWVAELKADKEVGGANFDKSRDLALRAIAKFGAPGLAEVLNSGWGDHPALFRTFAKIGKALAEDFSVDGSAATRDEDAAKVLYPNQK
jgi:hypothetical protein